MSDDLKCPRCGSRDYGPGPNFDNLRWIGCYKCGYGFKSEPPKRESSFEAWLTRCQYQNDGKTLRVFGESISIGIAKLIWDAAIAASKQPDFVE